MPAGERAPHPRIPRPWPISPAALVAALLAATTLAFLYTESLKLTPSPIIGTRVPTKVFAPGCGCVTDKATISFLLRNSDHVTVDVVRGKKVVRELYRGRVSGGERFGTEWDGRDDTGAIVPEGIYKPRVRLAGNHRTIVLPNPIEVDTTPPRVTMTRLAPRVFSPDGDRRKDRVVVGYRIDEPARVALYVDGVRAVLKKGRKEEGRSTGSGSMTARRCRAAAIGCTSPQRTSPATTGAPRVGRQS